MLHIAVFAIISALFTLTIPVSAVVISELMPAPSVMGEWIEFYNETEDAINLYGWHLADAAGNTGWFGEFTTIPPDGYLVAAPDRETLILLELAPRASVDVTGGWTPLNDDGDTVRLIDNRGNVMDYAVYDEKAARVKGRSWERIDHRGTGDDLYNWGSSADLRGHTAGRINSLRPVAPGEKTSVRAEPNPFNPTGRPDEWVTHINFTLPVPVSSITVDIYNLHSRRIRRLAANIPAGTRSPVLTWDGRSDSGKMMLIGRYIVMAEAVDIRSGKVYKAKCTVVLAGRLK